MKRQCLVVGVMLLVLLLVLMLTLVTPS